MYRQADEAGVLLSCGLLLLGYNRQKAAQELIIYIKT